MKRFGPKDVTYVALYEAKDAEYISKLNPDFLVKQLEKRYNDHIGLPEFIDVVKADDIVTFPGLSYCMQLILGSQTTRFTFMCIGSGLDKASPFQQLLITEAASRGNMATIGSMTLSGSTIMRFICNFPASFQTITIRESGVNTTSTPNTGILLNRNMFSGTAIAHTAGGTAFTIATDITFTALSP
jgi:hypothetical protein